MERVVSPHGDAGLQGETMDIVSFIVLARIGTYGPHVVATIGMAAAVLYIGWRLKLPYWQFAFFIVFAWQLHEFLSQIPMQIAHGTILSYLFSAEWEEGVILIVASFIVFRKRFIFQKVPWLVFSVFIAAYMLFGWPTTFPPNQQILWVGLLENAYHIYFLIPFWGLVS